MERVTLKGLKMNKPKYTEEMIKIIFLCLGVVFVGEGLFGFMGGLKPKPNSMIQDPFVMASIFFVIGIILIIICIILGQIVKRKDRVYEELIKNGIKISGKVERVYLESNIRYARQSPYRVWYVYSYQGKHFQKKSHFLWEKPNLEVGEVIVVYVNEAGKSAISVL